MSYYLIPLEDVELDPPKNLSLSQTTIELCLCALIEAEDRSQWIRDLQELTDTEWAKAEGFLTTAIEELSS